MITETDIANLIRQLAEARGWSVSHASRMASGNGDTVARIDGGIGMTLRRAAKIVERIDELWPADLPWPSDVPRPERAAKSPKPTTATEVS